MGTYTYPALDYDQLDTVIDLVREEITAITSGAVNYGGAELNMAEREHLDAILSNLHAAKDA